MTVTKQDASQSTWKVGAIAAYLAMVVMNALANTLPLFGRETGDVSARYPSLFTPAPASVSIRRCPVRQRRSLGCDPCSC